MLVMNELPAIVRSEAGSWYDLTESQTLIWTGQRLQANEPLYNMVLRFDIEGAIDTHLFQQAFQKLVDSCDALRTVFMDGDDGPKQRFPDSVEYTVEVLDFSHEPDPQARLDDWLDIRRVHNFDFGKCLFESKLIRMAEDRYVWYFNQHHLTTDASSTSILFLRMQEFYGLAKQGRLSEAGELPQYRDYVGQERDSRTSPQFARAQAYWKDRLAEPFVPSTFYRQPPAQRTGETVRMPYMLGAACSTAVKALATQNGFQAFTADLSHFQIFATALFAFLARTGGNSRLAIGTPTHNRLSQDLKATPGLFIELFPVQVEIDESESFASLYKKVASNTQQFLINTAPGLSSFAQNRAYDVVLNFITASFGEFDGLATNSEWIHAGFGDRNHLLRLQVHNFDRADEFVLYFDMNVDTFVGKERDRATQHFLRLLDAFLSDPEQLIARVPLLSSEDVRRLTVDYNAGPEQSKPGETLVEMFERQVEASPESVALTCDELSLSYDEFNSKVNQLARFLLARGVGSGKRVALCMSRSIDAMIAIVGVLKAGAAYVPVDPQYPAERIALILNDSGAMMVLTQQGHLRDLPDSRLEIVCIDRENHAIESCQTDNLSEKPHGGDNAYVIYTSGSTGRPKGVLVGHAGVANYVSWARRYYLDGEVLDFPLFSPLSYDLAVTSIFVPLISGGCVVIYPQQSGKREITIQRVIEDNAVDIIKLTPAHLALIQSLDFSRSCVRKLIVGGEDFKTDIARHISRRFGGNVEIYNEYGPTEGTVACMIHRYDPSVDNGASVPIGRSIDNLQVYLLDAHQNPVPEGVTGEIFIGGAGVARGYLNDEGLTGSRFVDDSVMGSGKMYVSGDLARWGPDGQMHYLGREDQQVKVRGVRVELGEIESALLNCEGISESVVTAIERSEITADSDAEVFCNVCGLSGNHPDAALDQEKVCRICRACEAEPDKAHGYFGNMDDLRAIVEKIKMARSGDHDCMVLLSGGKDSSYSLCRLVEMGLKPLVFTLDNGFISEGAKANIHRLVDALGLDLEVGETPAMNRIFIDSLNRYSDVCNGCFKTIYTLSMNLARKRGIKYIMTGLSRGQIFDTRLKDLFRHRVFDPKEIDRTIIEARKAYHRLDDVVAREMDVDIFKDDSVFEEIQFIDFYRYCDVTLGEVLEYLDKQAGWIRPADTGRSTNCLINEAGIYFHTRTKGYHNYALPYSWDVRLGHKERDAAREELDDDIDIDNARRMLNEIGYDGTVTAPARASDKRLAAYYVSSVDYSAADLRTILSQRLPDEFVPGYFTRVDRLPLASSGKVDRKALPRPEVVHRENIENYVAPEKGIEARLAELWVMVLGIDKVGRHDSFFDLGGDSILNIQIVAKARKRGISITPQQIFDHPTITELAAVVGAVVATEAEQGLVTGSLPLTPIQHRFFELDLPDPQYYSQSVLLEIPEDLDNTIIREAIEQLLYHHDALRSSFTRDGDEWEWVQRINGPDIIDLKLESIDLRQVACDEHAGAIDKAMATLQKGLDLRAGSMLRAARFQRARGQRDLLLLVIHHLVVDGVSWWILLEDLEQLCEQFRNGKPANLPPKTASAKAWSESLLEHARSIVVRNEFDFWVNTVNDPNSIPLDRKAKGANDLASARTVSVSLGTAETGLLLHEVPGSYHTQVPDAILTALMQAFSDWTGIQDLCLDIEGHGREEIADGLDLIRTVDWFTSVYPVRLRGIESPDPGDRLKSVKEQLRMVPSNGMNYGVLRYLADDLDMREKLTAAPARELRFNYLGQWDQNLGKNSCFQFASPIVGDFGRRGSRSYVIDINAVIFAGRLLVDWTYSDNLHTQASIEGLADKFLAELRDLIRYCVSSTETGFTPSDFPDADLDQQALDELLAGFDESQY